MSSQSEGYWSRSWALLTRDAGWYKPLLVLAAARMVPIVGPFGADGYGLEWARLTAWGVDSSPKQKGVDVGACIKSGARAFVVALGYALVIGVLRVPLTMIFGGALGGLISAAVGVFAAVLIAVAKLRATIYQSIGAGYQVQRIYDMVERDSKGLLSIVGLTAVMALVIIALGSMLIGLAFIPSLGDLARLFIEYERYGYLDDYYMAGMFLGAIGGTIPALCVVWYFLGVVKSGINLIQATAVGLWMRQFDVSNWGESSDPLPDAGPMPAEATPESYAPVSHEVLADQVVEERAPESEPVIPQPLEEEPVVAAPQPVEEPATFIPQLVVEPEMPSAEPDVPEPWEPAADASDIPELWETAGDESDVQEALDTLDVLEVAEPEPVEPAEKIVEVIDLSGAPATEEAEGEQD